MATPSPQSAGTRSRVALYVLEEIARLVAVWESKGWPETSLRTLRHWATVETAALSPRLPSPAPALDLMLRAGLITISPDGLARRCEELGRTGEERVYVDRFTPGDALAILQRLLLLPDFEQDLAAAFSELRITGAEEPRVRWSSISLFSQRNPAWIWLQQLGLGEHQQGDFVANTALIPFLLDVDVRRKRLSQDELDTRLQLQRQRADLAEEHIMTLERKRLQLAGVGYYAEGIARVSLEDVAAGYDIRSFDADGSPRYIEVKSSSRQRDQFFISSNEVAVARAQGRAYWLAWVGWALRLPSGPCEVAWFQNPIAIIEGSSLSPWLVENATAVVTRVRSDYDFQAQP